MLESYIEGKLPEIDWSAIVQKADAPTRNASATVLGVLAEKVGNMIVSSADLANSDKTDGFLNKTHELRKGDFSGAFLQAGVSELTMAVIMNGIALHGGVIAACGTFFVFSDYMKPAIRMAALMELPVKYVWSHDAFRVGEDGPTHQPVEQEAQIRLMEELHNLHGRPSMLVMRPADGVETTVAWQMAMENTHTPSALILTRQNVKDIPAVTGNRMEEAQGARRGGYVVLDAADARIVLVANGSEVSLCCEAASKLAEDGINVRVVSVPSIGLFNSQDEAYRRSVIPSGGNVMGWTAGLPSTLRSIDGWHGPVYGLCHFGSSAPFKVLDEKFGFTPANVVAVVKKYLGA